MHTPFEMLTDSELILILQRRGYIVRHKSEARRPLSWNRTEPIPLGVIFEDEAVAELRKKITPDLIHFETRQAVDDGPLSQPAIRSAFLRIL